MTYHKILVALDTSPQSEVVFTQALEIAAQDSAQLMLFHSLSLEASGYVFMELDGERSIEYARHVQSEIEQQRHKCQEWLEAYLQRAGDRGVLTAWDVKVGDAGRLICELAHSWEADLIVIGRRGLLGVMELLMGSTSSYVVHHASCAVLVVQGQTAAVAS
jgi:nucleotide-binding universal stress UspA family protein